MPFFPFRLLLSFSHWISFTRLGNGEDGNDYYSNASEEGDSQPEPLAEEIFLPGSGKVHADFCSGEDVPLVLRLMAVDFLIGDCKTSHFRNMFSLIYRDFRERVFLPEWNPSVHSALF